jgi:hypothetical protein
MNKFVEARPYADPEVAACKLMELANAVEPVQDGRIHIEKIEHLSATSHSHVDLLLCLLKRQVARTGR